MATRPASTAFPTPVLVRQTRAAAHGRFGAWRSRRQRAALAAGLARAAAPAPAQVGAFTAAVPVDARAVALARVELHALASRLRADDEEDPAAAVDAAERLLCDPGSPLYRPRWPEELREELRAVKTTDARPDPAPDSQRQRYEEDARL